MLEMRQEFIQELREAPEFPKLALAEELEIGQKGLETYPYREASGSHFGEELACGAPGGGHGNPFQYSCLENPSDKGAWRATVHGVTKSWT